MLGKRKQTGWQPRNKMRATKARMRSRATFAGPGYNPKAINLRAKPPPFAEKKFHELDKTPRRYKISPPLRHLLTRIQFTESDFIWRQYGYKKWKQSSIRFYQLKG